MSVLRGDAAQSINRAAACQRNRGQTTIFLSPDPHSSRIENGGLSPVFV